MIRKLESTKFSGRMVNLGCRIQAADDTDSPDKLEWLTERRIRRTRGAVRTGHFCA